MYEYIKDNVKKIENSIKDITSDEVIVIAASKTRSIDEITYVNDNTSIKIFGENKVQELLDKYDPKYKWHFIGQLQTNKVKFLIGKVDLIQSVDREKLVKTINRLSAEANVVTNILIEVNVAGEVSKGGVPIDQAFDFYMSMKEYKNIKVQGLMAVMPNIDDQTALKGYYLQMKNLYDKIKANKISNSDIKYLSLGMSQDYQLAIANGANMVRLGTIIFGERDYTKK